MNEISIYSAKLTASVQHKVEIVQSINSGIQTQSDSYRPPQGLKISEIIGNGTFGVVYKAELNGKQVAVKRVFQDMRYKNREKEIISVLNHQNVVKCLVHFQTKGEQKGDIYLNLVMEYMSHPLSKIIRDSRKRGEIMAVNDIRLFSYQIFKAFSYLEVKKICHRDVKPQNILVNNQEGEKQLKICDFGSAKQLIEGEANIAYICSRYYRAPELIFKEEHYTSAVDIWSIDLTHSSQGCVMAEMLSGEPLFPGENSIDQLIEIIRILGTPTHQQILMMNPNFGEYKFPQTISYPWSKVFEKILKKVNDCDKEQYKSLIDLISRVLVYSPQERPNSLEALAHPFFDELRKEQNAKKYQYLQLFEFSDDEKRVNQKLIDNYRLVPQFQKK